MDNSIPFFQSENDVTIKAEALLPDNLASFREVTLSDIEKQEFKCKTIATILNYFLGWYLTDADLQSKLGECETQREIEEISSIRPIRYTDTFRMAPGEAKRVAERLQYVPLVWREDRLSYYYNYRGSRNILPTSKLVKKINRSPAVVINKYKIRGSRSNYYSCSRILEVSSAFWDPSFNNQWERLLQHHSRNHYPSRGLDRQYEDLRLEYLIRFVRPNDGGWTDNMGDTITSTYYPNVSFAADLFNYLKDALAVRRNTPEIDYSDEEDYTELREFLIAKADAMDKANALLNGKVEITNARLIKANSMLNIVYKTKLIEPDVIIRHPSGSTDYLDYKRKVEDAHGIAADFIIGTRVVISKTARGWMVNRCNMAGYSTSSHHRPVLYNTHNVHSRVSTTLGEIFAGNSDYVEAIENNNCFSDHEPTIKRNARKHDYLSQGLNLLSWYQVYVPGRTNPYAQTRDIFFGIGRDIPEWYKSLHDSDTNSCKSLIQRNYGSRNGDPAPISEIDGEILKNISINHCNNCFHRSGGAGCDVFGGIVSNNWGGINEYQRVIRSLESAEEVTTEVCEPTVEAAEFISSSIERENLNLQRIETVVEEELLVLNVCEHGNSGPIDCLDCDESVTNGLTNAAEELAEATSEEDTDLEQRRMMELMQAWSQAER